MHLLAVGDLTLLLTAGRVRKGPAPVSDYICHLVFDLTAPQLNLEVPQYEITEGDSKLVIG